MECLKYAEKATAEVGQQYVITTFDLEVYMKAYPLVWNNAVKHEKHMILIGLCSHENGWEKMNGSGLPTFLWKQDCLVRALSRVLCLGGIMLEL